VTTKRSDQQGPVVEYGTAPTVRACVWLSGDGIEPSDVEARLGLPATESGRRGEPRPGRRPPVPKTFWKLVQEEQSFSIDTVVSHLLDKLWECKEIVREIGHGATSTGTFVVNIHIEEDRPEYCLRAETLSRLAFFGFELCMDIFDSSAGGAQRQDGAP
jgi:hypothetical protein